MIQHKGVPAEGNVTEWSLPLNLVVIVLDNWFYVMHVDAEQLHCSAVRELLCTPFCCALHGGGVVLVSYCRQMCGWKIMVGDDTW